MPEYVAFDPRIEVNGATVLAIVQGVGPWADSARRILEENGIRDPQPGRWYSQQAWLNAFAVIAGIGGRTLAAIGRCIPENATWPPDVKTVHDALASIDVAYHMNHRKDGHPLFDAALGAMREGIGHYRTRPTSDTSAEVTCETPYPCPFDTGIVTAIAREFAPDDAVVRVEHGPDCRQDGATACVLKVTW